MWAKSKLREFGIDYMSTEDVKCLDGRNKAQAAILMELIDAGHKVKVPVIITPELAEAFLLRNTDNIRNLNRKRVNEVLAPDVASGNWVPLNAVIAFDEHGCLKNGQHTMSAVVKGDSSIVAWVQCGITHEQEMVIDNCSPRKAHHSISGMNRYGQAALKSLLELGVNGVGNTSTHALSEYWNHFSAEVNQVMEVLGKFSTGKKPPGVAQFHAALVNAMCNGVDAKDIHGLVNEVYGSTTWLQGAQLQNAFNQNHYRGNTVRDAQRRYKLSLIVLGNYLDGVEGKIPSVDVVDRYDPAVRWSVQL